MIHLVLGYPGPVAARFLAIEAERGQVLATVARGVNPHQVPSGTRLIDGDPASIDFGLSGAQYQKLLEEVSHVTIAETSLRSIKDVEESPLVRQASEVVEFVQAGGAVQGVRFLSSLLVFGNKKGAVTEEDFQVGQRFESREEEALAVAEKVIRCISGRVPLSILRTAPIVGDEELGEVFEHSALSRLARQIEASSEDLPYSFSDLPVWIETVGRAARALSLCVAQERTKTFHLVDDEPLTDRALLQWLAMHSARTIVETPGGPTAWSNWLRAGGGDHRVVRGWGLHFGRQNAQETLGPLLDRDPLGVLTSLFGASNEDLVHV